MVIKTKFTELIGCKHPILLAGMGPFSTYRTAVKVSNNGGVGLTSHWGILTKVNPETHLIDRENGVMLSPKAKMEFDLEQMSAVNYKANVKELKPGYYLLIVKDNTTRFRKAFKFRKQ